MKPNFSGSQGWGSVWDTDSEWLHIHFSFYNWNISFPKQAETELCLARLNLSDQHAALHSTKHFADKTV